MSLFHTPEFVALNALPSIGADSGDGCMLLPGPQRGTYGGFRRAYGIDVMEELLRRAPQACTIKLAPASHDLQLFSRSMNVLHRAGFLLQYADLNYDTANLSFPFSERLAKGARKKLAKCERAGFESRVLERREWRTAHRLLWLNRHHAGRELALGLDRINALEAALPGTHIFFGTFAGREMIAAAITLKVREDVLYVYAWGDAEKNEYAPTVHLCKAIYEEAAFMSYRLLDVGISTERGVPNVGLCNFKSNLGFVPSIKATMVRR